MELTEVEVDGGVAIGCAGGLVLGYWYVPFNAKRLRMCGAAYGRVADRNGVFSILTVFRVNPYTLSSALSEQLRNATVELLAGWGEKAVF
jgi:hypothetical protein